MDNVTKVIGIVSECATLLVFVRPTEVEEGSPTAEVIGSNIACIAPPRTRRIEGVISRAKRSASCFTDAATKILARKFGHVPLRMKTPYYHAATLNDVFFAGQDHM